MKPVIETMQEYLKEVENGIRRNRIIQMGRNKGKVGRTDFDVCGGWSLPNPDSESISEVQEGTPADLPKTLQIWLPLANKAEAGYREASYLFWWQLRYGHSC
jgi:hypothetical protein